MARYRIGNDMTILWTVNDKDGSPFSLVSKEVHLYYTCERGRFEADIEIQENLVAWNFLGSKQRVLGDYTLTLEVLQSDGKRAIRRDICNAFTLVGKSCFEETEGGANVLEGGEIVLSSELDIYRISPIVPTIGPNGNWWIDGKDSGYLASTARNNIRELFIPEIGFNTDGSHSITKELTSEQKAYNAETASILKNGQRPLLFSPLDGIVNYFVSGDGKYVFHAKQTAFGDATIEKVICLLESGDIEFIGVRAYGSMYDFRDRELVYSYIKSFNKEVEGLSISTVYSSPINSDTNYPSVVDRLYWEGDVLAIEFNYEDKRYKQTFNKETGELIEETDITPSGFLRLLYVPDFDEAFNIIGELTPEQKEYNAETARRLRNGEPITLSMCNMGSVFDYTGFTSVNSDDISCYFWYSTMDGNANISITLQNDGTISYASSTNYFGTYPFYSPEGVINWRDCFPYSLYWGRIRDNYGGSYITANAVSLGSRSDIECIIADYTFEGKNIRRYYSMETGEMVHEETLSSSDSILRTVYLPETDEDGNIVTPLTDEKKAYNAETVRLIMGPNGATTVISLGGVTFNYTLNGSSRIECYAETSFLYDLFAIKFDILLDGSIEGCVYAECPTMCFFSNPEEIKDFFAYAHLTGAFEPHRIVPATGYGNGFGMVYSYCEDVLDGKKVFKIHYYDAYGRQWYDYYDSYTCKFISKHEVETGGGTGIDLEALDGLMPMSRDFSDDFNNDFAR